MKREGRQHGLVRTYCILPSTSLAPNTNPIIPRKANPSVGSPPTAGIYARVPSKPTNHSKFTGKCGRPRCSDCHLHPSWKSKDKVKGTRKVRDLDFGYGGLIAWRVMGLSQDGSRPTYKLKLERHSASRILDELVDCGCDEDEEEEVEIDKDCQGHVVYESQGLESNWSTNLDCLGEFPFIPNMNGRVQISDIEEVEDPDGSSRQFGEIVVVRENEEDDDMGFYDVAFVWEPIEGDEGWSLVGEI